MPKLLVSFSDTNRFVFALVWFQLIPFAVFFAAFGVLFFVANLFLNVDFILSDRLRSFFRVLLFAMYPINGLIALFVFDYIKKKTTFNNSR